MTRQLDRRRVKARFERAAPGYDQVSAVHQEVGRRLREHLDPVKIDPHLILDAGAGTGICLRDLAVRYPRARLVALDLAHAMLQEARGRVPWWSRRQHHVCADAERLPIVSGRVDLAYSNLALQWCDDLDRVFSEIARVTAPGALLMLSTLGPDTFKELRAAWDEHPGRPSVHTFADMHDIGDGLVRAGFTGIVMESETLTVEYRDARALVADLRAQAATCADATPGRGLTGRQRASAFYRALDDHTGDRVRLTYEVVYAHAWRAAERMPSIAVEDLIGARRG